MAEESKTDKYIICSKCKSKYINDEEHIKNDFGYTRLEERYKTCVKCRARGKTFYINHRDEILDKNHNYYEQHKDKFKEHNKQYRENNIDSLREHDRARSKTKIVCPSCNKEVCKKYLAKHQETNNCKNNIF